MISQVAECGCSDIDCKSNDCLGNRLEVVLIGFQERIKMIAPHHKGDGSRSVEASSPIIFILPDCPLNTLLLWWVKTGWQLVRQGKKAPSPMVFASGHLKTFSCYTMVGWWELFKSLNCPSTLKPGTITELRSCFIEAYTERVKDESKWAKAALVMGNSVPTWRKYYAATLKKRKLQDGIDSFASDFLDGYDEIAGGCDEGEESDEMDSAVPMRLPCSSRPQAKSSSSDGLGLVVAMGSVSLVEIEGDELGSW